MIKREEKWTISLQLVDAQVLKKRKKSKLCTNNKTYSNSQLLHGWA
jgi:hypothetical protein